MINELRKLVSNNTHFSWNETLEKEFIDLKNEISKLTALQPFDPSLPMVIRTDASKKGLGQSQRDPLPLAEALPNLYSYFFEAN